jgi:hypothetical protein
VRRRWGRLVGMRLRRSGFCTIVSNEQSASRSCEHPISSTSDSERSCLGWRGIRRTQPLSPFSLSRRLSSAPRLLHPVGLASPRPRMTNATPAAASPGGAAQRTTVTARSRRRAGQQHQHEESTHDGNHQRGGHTSRTSQTSSKEHGMCAAQSTSLIFRCLQPRPALEAAGICQQQTALMLS